MTSRDDMRRDTMTPESQRKRQVTAGADAVEQIREEAEEAFGGVTFFHRYNALRRLRALLDGVTGLARGGDVVLNAEQAAKLHALAEAAVRIDAMGDSEGAVDWGHAAWAYGQLNEAVLAIDDSGTDIVSLLASAPRGEEQA